MGMKKVNTPWVLDKVALALGEANPIYGDEQKYYFTVP